MMKYVFASVSLLTAVAPSICFGNAGRILKENHKALVMMNHLFIHKGMMYFFIGVMILFAACKLNIFNKWLDFLHTLQHELTHIVVAGLFGGIPVSMEVKEQEGAAYTTKSNFIIRLSPYVLPIFSLFILGISFLLNVEYKPTAFVLAGLFYGNFVKKTLSSLHIQPDILKSGGRIIAYPVIFVINVAVLAAIGHMVKGL
ncbi:MAG: hypothetical protein AB1480_11680 [Nitrospirota bacterium]